MSVILLGPPGAGKGTQAARLSARFGFTVVNSGAMLRQHVRDGTAIGRAANAYMTRGDLVPDDVIVDVVLARVRELAGRRLVIDGFPKTLAQATVLDRVLDEISSPPRLVVHFAADRETLHRRLLGRADEQSRADDRPESVDRRLTAFATTPAEVLDVYRRMGVLSTVDAVPEPSHVEEVIAALVLTSMG